MAEAQESGRASSLSYRDQYFSPARSSTSMSISSDRYAGTRAVLGAELFDKVQKSRILVVGCVELSATADIGRVYHAN